LRLSKSAQNRQDEMAIDQLNVLGRVGHRGMAVRTEGNTTLEDIGRRVHVSSDFAEKIYDIVSPGTTIVVTDAPATRSSSASNSVFLMEATKK
jgi:hypothetical protein